MIIDAHTHYGTASEEATDLSPTLFLQALERAGVDGACVMTLRGLRPGAGMRECNDEIAEVASHAPDRLIPFATVNPFEGPSAVAEMERCLTTLGMKGLKLHPWLQGFPRVGGKELHEICELCGAHGAPVVFHDGTPNVSMPSQVAQLARAHPRTPFVLGHSGLLHLWRQAAEAAALHANVHVTLCGPHPAALAHLIREVPIERILWGSDYILGWEALLGYRKGLVERMGLPEPERRAIMGENAARLVNAWR